MSSPFSRAACLAACLAACAITASSSGVVIHVDDDAPPGGDGLTWDTAFRFLQDALAYAEPWQHGVTEIRIGQGLYRPDRDEAHPDGSGDSSAAFDPGTPHLNGGYAGIGSSDPDARNPEAFPTVLSGDLVGDDQPGFVNYGNNSVYVIENGATIDGCTVRSGVRGLESEWGTTVTNCRFVLNLAAIAIPMDGQLQADLCVFDQNQNGIGGVVCSASLNQCMFLNHTGSAVSFDEALLSIHGCTFTNSGASAIRLADCFFNVTACDFVDNSASQGGAVFAGMGATDANNGAFTSCRFEGNSAARGGAIYARGNDEHNNDIRFINCVFYDNSATQTGGVMHSLWSDPKFVNCTMARNSANIGGGVYSAATSTLRVYNSIIRANKGGSFGGPGPRTVRYSNIAGLALTVSLPANPMIAQFLTQFVFDPGAGNINVDPQFVDPENGDLRLKAGSASIDAGRNAYLPGSVATDLNGNPRFINIPGAPNTDAGSPPHVDMGAYERQP